MILSPGGGTRYNLLVPEPLDYAQPATRARGRAPPMVWVVMAPLCLVFFMGAIGVGGFGIITIIGAMIVDVSNLGIGLVSTAVGAVLLYVCHRLARFIEEGWPR